MVGDQVGYVENSGIAIPWQGENCAENDMRAPILLTILLLAAATTQVAASQVPQGSPEPLRIGQAIVTQAAEGTRVPLHGEPAIGFIDIVANGRLGEVLAIDETGVWILIQLSDGKLGWVQRSDLRPADASERIRLQNLEGQ